MFKIIEPQHHCFYLSSINHFMEHLKNKNLLRLSKQEQNKATFILFEGEEKGVSGGAMLLKKSLSDFPHELSRTLLEFVSFKEKVWECKAFLFFEEDCPLCKTNESEHFCQIFYRNLYHNLVEFGKKEGTGFLCVSLDSGEHLCTEGVIFWPYIVEIKPQQSSDGLFHGILSLTGSQYEEYQKNWKNLKCSEAAVQQVKNDLLKLYGAQG